MPYMEPVYNILEKHHGKVIYFDFWARWCPPCLAEMEPLKQLRSKYSTKDLVNICRYLRMREELISSTPRISVW